MDSKIFVITDMMKFICKQMFSELFLVLRREGFRRVQRQDKNDVYLINIKSGRKAESFIIRPPE